MKLILKTSTFILLALLMVFTGKLINALAFEKIRINGILEEAEVNYQKFTENFDSGKKTIVIVGTSTSLFSFPDDSNVIQKSSYVEMLNEQTNTLNLASTNLHYASEASALIKFAQEKLPESHLTILENLSYIQPLNIFTQYAELKSVGTCLTISATNPLFRKRQCKQILKDYFVENFKWFKNPCLKKHNEALTQAFMMDSKTITNTLVTVMKCNEEVFKSNEVPLELMDLFHFGHFRELKEAFRLTGHTFNEFSEREYTDKYERGELFLINSYLNRLSREYADERFLVIPTPARRENGLSELPVFKKDDGRFALIEVYEEIDQMRALKDLKFYDIFPDGSHSRVWVHELLANKIFPKLSKSVRMNFNE